MRRLAATLALTAGLLAFGGVSAASAQIFIVETGPDGAKVVSAISTKLKVSGAVTVDFHGDAAAGCADVGLCDVSGRVVWDPGTEGEIDAFGFRQDGVRFEQSFMTFGGNEEEELGPPLSSARVQRALRDGGHALCADVKRQSFAVSGAGARPGRVVSVSPVGESSSGFALNDFVRTRCAGPIVTDVAQALPVRRIGERTLRHGRGTLLDFSADAPFSAGGLSGTVHSTLKMRLGKASDLLRQQRGYPGPTHPFRYRELEVEYQLERLSGEIVTEVEGLTDPDLCGPLDACGLVGTVTATPRVATGEGYALAIASIRHSKHELRRALGLAPGGRPKGVHAFGYVFWDQTAGHVTSNLSRQGADPCTDSQAFSGPGSVALGFGRHRVRADFGGAATVSGDDLLRTRCPGPGLTDVATTGGLVHGRLPLSAFGRRRVAVRLTRGDSFASDGYRGTSRADMTVGLRRTSVKAHIRVIQLPTGVEGGLFRIGR